MSWILKQFEELTNIELYNILKLRSEIFVVEQNCVYLDIDGSDPDCYHFYKPNDEGIILAYCRIVPPGLHYTEASIGRVVSNTKHRGYGYGKELLEQSILCCNKLYANTSIKIGAQLYLKKFYESFGFVQVSEIYDEDGIDHIKMLRQ
jgi:ElaA protein